MIAHLCNHCPKTYKREKGLLEHLLKEHSTLHSVGQIKMLKSKLKKINETPPTPPKEPLTKKEKYQAQKAKNKGRKRLYWGGVILGGFRK